MDYSKYTVEELVLDDYFRKWVNGELPDEDLFWETWLTEKQERKELVDQAVCIVKALRMEHETLSELKIREKVELIMAEAGKEEERSRSWLFSYGWKVAASLLLTAGLAWYFIRPDVLQTSRYEAMVEAQGSKTVEKINNADRPLKISLSDGSSITLQPGSKLSYPESFAIDRREVILSGEGFFDIAGDPERPFLVYANEIVTKVLGTSFSIKAYEDGKDITVKVVTGRVSVLPAKTARGDRSGSLVQGLPGGLILTPNQMAVYARAPERLTRTLVDNPGIIKGSDKKSSDYNFQDTPAATVFRTLEEGYGVTIVYDADLLSGCTITAPLENETLFEKLDMICKVIRSTYEVVDAQVVITSKGCE